MDLLARLRNITAPQWLTKVIKPKKEYPLVDLIVLFYVGFTLTFQVFLQISPFVSWLATTPIYSMQTYLGILGGALIVVDLFTTKKIWKGKYVWFLYTILVLAAIASIRMVNYGVKENIFKLCWATVQYVLVYSCIYRVHQPGFKKWVTALFYVLLAVWVICCCVSLYQYLNLIGYRYVVNPLSADSSSNRQGFYDNRLFGIFYTLNHAAYISLLFSIISLTLFKKQKRKWVKVVMAVCIFILFCHIVLTYSRSAYVSMTVSVFVVSWFIFRKKWQDRDWCKRVLSLVLSAVITIAFWFGLQGFKVVMTYMPTWYGNAICFVQVHILGNEDYQWTARIPEYDDKLLDRDYLESDVSNGRLRIWGDYISLYKEIGAIGLSPGSYMQYTIENHPDMYVVEQTRIEYPDKMESGIIFHAHNGYLLVYVSAGFLGALCLIAFISLCLKKVGHTIIKNKQLPRYFIGAFFVVMVLAISAVFDEGLFFQNSPYTTLFWFTLGFLLKKCDDFALNTKSFPEGIE